MKRCWKGKREWAEEAHGWGSPEWAQAYVEDGTCLLPDGHPGEHEWTPDADIVISFPAGEGLA